MPALFCISATVLAMIENMKGGDSAAASAATAGVEAQAADAFPASAGASITNSGVKQPEPLYLPACGALCDVLWWARRRAD